MSQVFIYALVDPRLNLVRYVGQTTDLANRFRQHQRERDWMTDLLALDMKAEMRILEVCDSTTADEAERKWIARNESPDLENSAPWHIESRRRTAPLLLYPPCFMSMPDLLRTAAAFLRAEKNASRVVIELFVRAKAIETEEKAQKETGS